MMRRFLFSLVTTLLLLARSVAPSFAAASDAEPMRAVQVDLDYVNDPDPDQTNRNLGHLVERIKAMNITAVFLQGFADPKGTGLASSLYFPNRNLPVANDLFARAVTELQTHAHVKVYGWIPVLSFDLDTLPQVMMWDPESGVIVRDPNPKAYRRLSPFNKDAEARIFEIYEDMAKAAPIDGVLFHDDALLTDFEDASPDAMDAYKKAGINGSIEDIRNDPKLMGKWTDFKTQYLIKFTQKIAEHMRRIHAPLMTVRNIYAPLVLTPESETRFAQSYNRFLTDYDYTAVEAMPRMEGIPDDEAQDWMERLVAAASRNAQGLKRTIFELQSVDWNLQALGQDRAIPSDMLAGQMRYLAEQGAENFGYYPDDFVTNTPDLAILQNNFSLPTHMNQP
jgi:biofilm PGA synthesis lipoprotein PgaB